MSVSTNKYFSDSASISDELISSSQRKSVYDALKENHFPEAKWNVGGAFRFDSSIQAFNKYFRQTMEGYTKIGTASGSPACLWTLDWYKPRPLTRLTTFREILDQYAENNMAISICFDNPIITDDQLKDNVGNIFLSEAFSRDRLRVNSISVASEKLANHIRHNFPKIRLHAHVNRLVAEQGKRNAALYEKLAENYSRVSIHPADNIKWDLMESLKDKDKFEITINDNCLRACPVRRDHMAALARIREAPYSAEFLQQRHKLLNLAGCEKISGGQLIQKQSLQLTKEEWKRLYDMGFRRFRIQAEGLRNEISFLWDTARAIWGTDPKISEKIGLIVNGYLATLYRDSTSIPSGLKDFASSSYE